MQAFASHRSDPHFKVNVKNIYQHIDTQGGARSLRNDTSGVQTNRDSAVQIEIVGFAHLPKDRNALTNLARFYRWVEGTHGVLKDRHAGFPKPAKNGRDPGGHNRDPQIWGTKGGHYGHCHVPENTHWEPLSTSPICASSDCRLETIIAIPQVRNALGIGTRRLVAWSSKALPGHEETFTARSHNGRIGTEQEPFGRCGHSQSYGASGEWLLCIAPLRRSLPRSSGCATFPRSVCRRTEGPAAVVFDISVGVREGNAMSGRALLCSLITIPVLLTACANNPPEHVVLSLTEQQVTSCRTLYDKFDAQTQSLQPSFQTNSGLSSKQEETKTKEIAEVIRKNIDASIADESQIPCWKTAWEQHKDYDLFFAEFDDEGWAADLRDTQGARPATGEGATAKRKSEIDQIFERLKAYQADNTPVDIVIFTHGWHGSAQPGDWYVVQFRALLNTLAGIDHTAHERPANGASPLFEKPRRVVGIYVGWRGDSILFPNVLSVWDRKLAAETVSVGAVQGLFSQMHKYYLDNSCHLSNGKVTAGVASKCGRVRLLTIGHSYGALINFRSLLGNMETGQSVDADRRVYSFGDLVVLLNPAFEATRYAPLFTDATRRASYFGSEHTGGSQLPVVLTLQSEGDWATGLAFPAFRRFTTLAENPQGPERAENLRGLGWYDGFSTHRLCYSPMTTAEAGQSALCAGSPKAPPDTCDGGAQTNHDLYSCRARWWATEGFQAVHQPSLYMGGGLWLLQKDQPPTDAALPQNFPYWMVRVDKPIMFDHDDIWNSKVNAVILQIYRAVVEQSDQQVRTFRERAPLAETPAQQ